MIKIFQYADFNFDVGAYQRIRKTIALRLDPMKFQTIAFGRNHGYPRHVRTISPYVRSKGFRRVCRMIGRTINFTKGHIRGSTLILDNLKSNLPSYPYSSTLDLIPVVLKNEHLANINIFHSITFPVCILLLSFLKTRNPDVKHILTVHLFHQNPFGRRMQRHEPYFTATKILARSAHIVTAVSEHTKRQVENAFNVDCQVIHDGVDTTFFKPKEHKTPSERLKILYLGRLEVRKRPHYVARLAKIFPQCDFIIHGKAGYPMLWQESEKVSNLTINTHVVSFEDLREIYRNSDIFLFPSIHEGLPNVVLEAMASGLPVICSNAISLPEMVDHGKNGFLCNNLREFKDNLQYLIQDESLRKKFSENSRKKALSFDWSRIVPQWEKLYEEVVSSYY